MNPATLMRDLAQMRATIRLQGVILALLGLALVLAVGVMYGLAGRERIVVTPPAIDKTFWVAGDRVSGSYLEQMAGFVAYLVLDVSPESIGWKEATLLRYVSPEAYGALQTRQEIAAARLRRLNATTQFAPAQLIPDEASMSVRLRGRLATFVNGERTSDEDKEYRARFALAGGRIELTDFREVSHGTQMSPGPGAAD
jgi:conjugal transfer pilus assembly protein TraE